MRICHAAYQKTAQARAVGSPVFVGSSITNPIDALSLPLAQNHLQLAIGQADSESFLPGLAVLPNLSSGYHSEFPDIVNPGLLADDPSRGSKLNASEITRKAIDISDPSLHPAKPLSTPDNHDTSDLYSSGQEVVENCFDDLLQASPGSLNPIFRISADGSWP